MKSPTAILLCLALLVPVAIAHTPPGPKNFCESFADWSVHDYVGVWTPGYQVLSADGNHAGDCDGDTVPADHDGHMDWATGGATLLADNGNYANQGAWACLGELADHVPQTPIIVIDAVAGGAVRFEVSADWSRPPLSEQVASAAQRVFGDGPVSGPQYNPPPPPPPTKHENDCGDGIIEACDPTDPTAIDGVTCNSQDRVLVCLAQPIGSASNECTPTFYPGGNGDYLVRVVVDTDPSHPSFPVAGHIIN